MADGFNLLSDCSLVEGPVTVAIRPENIELTRADGEDSPRHLRGTVTVIRSRPTHTEVELDSLFRLPRGPPFSGTNLMDGAPSWESVWRHLVRGGPMIGRDRGGDDLKWSLGASLRMTCKGCRATELWRGCVGSLGLGASWNRGPWPRSWRASTRWPCRRRGTRHGPPWAARGPRVRSSDNLPQTAVNKGVEADPGPSSRDRQVVMGKPPK